MSAYEKDIFSIKNLIADGKLDLAISQLRTRLTLAESELAGDMIMLSGQYKKLRSDTRKRILSYDQEQLAHNRIANSILELLEEIAADPESHFKGFEQVSIDIQKAEEDREKIHQELDAETIGQSLSKVVRLKNHRKLEKEGLEVLYERLSGVKEKNLSVRGLWIDDFPDSIQYEKEILTSIGIHFDIAINSSEGFECIRQHAYELVISDILREGKPAGIPFLQKLIQQSIDIPFIFYIAELDRSKGVPPYAFGIASYPLDLIHLILDVLARKY